MKQTEMTKYLKLVTAGLTLLFLLFVVWLLPTILTHTLLPKMGRSIYLGICGFAFLTALPCLFSLWKFWGICLRIGEDHSFSCENADALKRMSHAMLTDAGLYAVFLTVIVFAGLYQKVLWLLFAAVLIFFICVALAILLAALSHLVYKASRMQEEQDLTI